MYAACVIIITSKSEFGILRINESTIAIANIGSRSAKFLISTVSSSAVNIKPTADTAPAKAVNM